MRLLYILPLLLAPTALAQTYVSAYGAGGPSSDIGEAVATGPDGAVYVAGTFEGTADFGDGVTATSAGDSDAFLVKYDADGTALWARRAGTDVFNDFGEDVAVDGDRAVYLAGTFTGIATFDGGTRPDTSITTLNDFDAFLARYTADGDLDWVRRVGGTEQDVGRAVAVTPDYEQDGPVALVGTFAGSAEAGDTTLVSAGGSDAFAAVFSPEGEPLWARSAGGSGSDAGYDGAFAFRADSAPEPFGGDFYLAGQFSGVGVFGPGVAVQSAGLGDAFVARYSADGEALWASRVGGAGSDYARGLVLAQLGDAGDAPGLPYVYLGGSFSEDILVGADVLQSAGFTDVFLAAFDAEGDALWGRSGGGEGFDFAEDVTTFPTYAVPVQRGSQRTPVFLTGYFDDAATFSTSDTTVALVSAGGQDGFVAAYAANDFPDAGPDGALLAAYAVGGADRDAVNGVSVRPQSGFSERDLNPVLTGAFRGTVDFPGAGPVTSRGGLDLFVAELSACPDVFCLPTDAEPGAPTALLGLSASPNPFATTAALTLTLPTSGEVHVAAFDVLGRRVAVLLDGPLAAGRHPLALGDGLAPGLYLVRAETAGGAATLRVTKSR